MHRVTPHVRAATFASPSWASAKATAPRWSSSNCSRSRPTLATAGQPDDKVVTHSVRALAEYDGTDYLGFQVQRDAPTVQGTLEQALQRLTGEPTRIRYAGRTDAGVHASGQVIAAEARWRHSLEDLERAWNAVLPQDVAVRELKQVDDSTFHPRYSALSRLYRYTVWTAPWRSPLHQRYAHHEPRPLDVVAMNRAASILTGSHDFASFGQPTQGEVTVRRVDSAEWRQDGPLLTFEIEANAFLRRMVRTIVATLLEVGVGRRSVADVSAVLAARERSKAAPPAPACGLCLVAVTY
ncbi:MAG: tRNA pseudouridine(38-40) synthase TruA [Anaerolineae bacterium]|nr:tRNA pseudouridine(38-40) synthase TruA [Anaerolineae bacterium]